MKCVLRFKADLFDVHLSSDLLLKSELILMKNDKKFKSSRATKIYRGADKSLARPWKETSYSDRNNIIPRLTAYKQQEYIPVVCRP